MITEVRIKGQPVPLDRVEYQVTIQTGSAARWEIPQATTCQIAIWSDDVIPAVVGDELTIIDDDIDTGNARFRGQVTNVELSHPDPGIVRQLVTAQGPLMRLGRMTVGYGTLPEQTAADRLADLMAMAGVYAQVMDDGWPAVMAARPLDDQKGSFMFGETMRSEPFDVWEMNIPLELRQGITFDTAQFDESDPAAPETAVFIDTASPLGYAVELWGEQSRSDVNLYAIPSHAVMWEPRWKQDTGRVVNDITITYGDYPAQGSSDKRPTVRVQSAASKAAYGPASTQITTDILGQADAGRTATQLLDEYASPKWEMASCELLLDELSTIDRKMAMTMIRPGRAIHIEDLPQPAPATYSDFWVEGFTEVYSPGRHTMTLALTSIPTGPRFDFMEFDNADPTSPATAVLNY